MSEAVLRDSLMFRAVLTAVRETPTNHLSCLAEIATRAANDPAAGEASAALRAFAAREREQAKQHEEIVAALSAGDVIQFSRTRQRGDGKFQIQVVADRFVVSNGEHVVGTFEDFDAAWQAGIASTQPT